MRDVQRGRLKPQQSRAGLPDTASMRTLSSRLGSRDEHRPDPGGTVCALGALTTGFRICVMADYLVLQKLQVLVIFMKVFYDKDLIFSSVAHDLR